MGFPQPRLFLPMSPCFSLTLFPPSSICLAFSFSLPHLVPSLPTHFSLPLSLYPHERPQLLGGSVNSATPSPICCPKYITYPGPLAQGCRNTSSSGTRRGASSSGYPSWLWKESLTLPQEGPRHRSDGVRSRGESVPTGCWP